MKAISVHRSPGLCQLLRMHPRCERGLSQEEGVHFACPRHCSRTEKLRKHSTAMRHHSATLADAARFVATPLTATHPKSWTHRNLHRRLRQRPRSLQAIGRQLRFPSPPHHYSRHRPCDKNHQTSLQRVKFHARALILLPRGLVEYVGRRTYSPPRKRVVALQLIMLKRNKNSMEVAAIGEGLRLRGLLGAQYSLLHKIHAFGHVCSS